MVVLLRRGYGAHNKGMTGKRAGYRPLRCAIVRVSITLCRMGRGKNSNEESCLRVVSADWVLRKENICAYRIRSEW